LRGAVPGAGLSTAALAIAAIAVQQQLDLVGLYVPIVLSAFLVGAAFALRAAARQLSGSFGAANHVTLFRGALTALVAGLIIAESSPAVLWFAIAAAGSALLLDGIDGSLARRFRVSSPFGARFDMETDAITTIVLAMLVWRFDKAGVWVLLSGLLRYAFVAAGREWPWLRAPLPPSKRRQAICVVQISALLVCLAPFVSAEQSERIAALALVLLGGSFAIDTLWLHRHAAPRA
jgi:phosphatidylglycerophosphate synthase